MVFAGFRGARRDALMGDVGQPPHVSEDGEMGPSSSHEEGDSNPCLEDEEFHKAPDADSMEEAKLWIVWRDRNALALARFTVCFNAFWCQCTTFEEPLKSSNRLSRDIWRTLE